MPTLLQPEPTDARRFEPDVSTEAEVRSPGHGISIQNRGRQAMKACLQTNDQVSLYRWGPMGTLEGERGWVQPI